MAVNRMVIQILKDSDRRPSLAIQLRAAKKCLSSRFTAHSVPSLNTPQEV